MFAGKPIIGVVGGIGSGKSHVSRLFAEIGCLVVNSDEQVADAYRTPGVKAALRQWWGDGPFDARGDVIRAAVARKVFDDPAERKRLEGLLHPLVADMRREAMGRAAADPGVKAFVWDTPLLIEAGLHAECDAVVFVDAPAERRLERVAASRGWDSRELSRREKIQLPLDKKREVANYIVSNTAGADDDVRSQVREVLSRILAGVSDGRRSFNSPPA